MAWVWKTLDQPTNRNLEELSLEYFRWKKFFFDKGENASQVADIANGVYGANTVTANYVQFWFRRFRSSIFDVKDAPLTGRPVVENVEKTQKKSKSTGL
ncbi:histone-lysine N-methyltransferase SETMAR [Trichonephila clavipes]|nr:histone-lysine N-methyltransferase SETMAR [Trichonephila clavipes]